jgi:hypothetical protein
VPGVLADDLADTPAGGPAADLADVAPPVRSVACAEALPARGGLVVRWSELSGA